MSDTDLIIVELHRTEAIGAAAAISAVIDSAPGGAPPALASARAKIERAIDTGIPPALVDPAPTGDTAT